MIYTDNKGRTLDVTVWDGGDVTEDVLGAPRSGESSPLPRAASPFPSPFLPPPLLRPRFFLALSPAPSKSSSREAMIARS